MFAFLTRSSCLTLYCKLSSGRISENILASLLLVHFFYTLNAEKAAREKKMCPRKKNENFAREKKNPSREKNAKFCPRKLKKYPRKNMLKKSDMIFFSCYFWDCGGLMLRRFFLDFFNAFVKTILSLFWPNFVRACGELAIMSCLNCVLVCTGPLRL